MREKSVSCPCLCAHMWPEVKVSCLPLLFTQMCDAYVYMYAHMCAPELAHAYMCKGQEEIRLGDFLYVVF